MRALWDHPTLFDVQLNNFTQASNALTLSQRGTWFYLLITNIQEPPQQAGVKPASHPMHLHGHDFSVLSQGRDPWNGTVKTDNPLRRDIAMLDVVRGHLPLAWKVDNPGVWLLHCQIGLSSDRHLYQLITFELTFFRLAHRDGLRLSIYRAAR